MTHRDIIKVKRLYGLLHCCPELGKEIECILINQCLIQIWCTGNGDMPISPWHFTPNASDETKPPNLELYITTNMETLNSLI